MDDRNDIELRSEKVRNIIGKIPPLVIRTGVGVISLVFTVLFSIACSYRFNETIECNAILYPTNSIIRYEIAIPVDNIKKITQGQEIEFSFHDKYVLRSVVSNIDTVVHINKNGSYYNITGIVNKSDLTFEEVVNARTTIILGKVNVIEYILNRNILNKN
ncbi:hypothetical protein K4L44_03815 [Halosquirtibacter laminarini]|uniref:Uncharacterized protein n=1 Tax=Halosquirtibacter laminarini TaxID=3374600 RepID=A0AC61NR71_9BACT|nr:hypothetical protein K4L44_03815 [Prolixibacteraceae bacterium]